MMSIFYFIFSAVLLMMQLIVGLWLMKCYPQVSAKAVLGFCAVGTGLILGGLSYTHVHQEGLFSGVLYYVAYTYVGFIFLAFCLCGLLFLVRGCLACCGISTAWMGPATFVLLLVIITMALWGGFSSPRVKRVAVSIPGAPRMKLALLSDTHLGMGVSLKRFKKVLEKIEAQRPDLLLVLGDVFEYGPHREQYAARLKQTCSALPCYGVFGNHEYYVGYAQSKAFYKDAGIELLENQTFTLPNGVRLVGLRDIQTAHVTAQEVADLLGGADKTKPTLLLSHIPLHVKQAARHGADLMLSGHTHNGQLWPFTYLVKLRFPYVYGLHEIDAMKLYVTSGVFYWGIPLRFLAPAEIAILEVNA